MTPLLLIGLSIVLNAVLLTGGLLWSKRQVKRVAAERAAEYRGMFKLEMLPPAGDKVLILVEEDDSRPTEIEGVHWPHLGWTDAVTLLKVKEEVLGWRRHPFRREPPPVDMEGWTDEQVTAELERRFGDMPTSSPTKVEYIKNMAGG